MPIEPITLRPGNYDLVLNIKVPFYADYIPFLGGWKIMQATHIKEGANATFAPLGVHLNAIEAPGMFSDAYELYITVDKPIDVNVLVKNLTDYLKDKVNKYIKIIPKEAVELTPEQVEKKSKQNFLKGLGDLVKRIAFIGTLGLIIIIVWSPPVKALFQVKEKK